MKSVALLGLAAVLLLASQDADASTDTDTTGLDMTPNDNRRAFLAMIRQSEGTAGPNGYRMYFGGSLFDSYADHPRVKHTVNGITSSAAGAYQILTGTWDTVIQPHLHLPDFSPASQDAAAIYLLQRRGALSLIDAGHFTAAVAAASPEWASLPGAGYGQHENELATLRFAYVAAGGSVAA